MKDRLVNLLIFLKLVDDHDKNLSLTNVALIVVITKMALLAQFSMVDAGTLLVAIGNYNMKKWMNNDK